jgi:serine/threonine protein kinase
MRGAGCGPHPARRIPRIFPFVATTKICTQCGTVYDINQKFCPADGSPLRFQSADDPLIGQMVAERYQILSLIGEGGMGRVYLAEHVRMGRKSAVKVINPALATTADAISRFNREAANACKINHPNVAQVYDFGEMADGTLYLAMEFVDGETLDAIVSREGSLPPARAAQITKQVADALYAAHHLDIVHRDLKPENVMVARHLDGSDWVKVVDFGIAKTVQRDGRGSQTVTMTGVSLGTPEYMSPEQLAGETLDHRTDIYSLGLVLFNMLTGDLPYPKVTSKETLVRRLTSRPRTLADLRPDVVWPPALQGALDRALATEAAERFDNVGEFGRAVVRAVESADASAVATATVPPPRTAAPNPLPPGDARLGRSMIRRRAVPWAVATAVVLAAVVLAANLSTRHNATMVMDDSGMGTMSFDTSVSIAAPSIPALPAQPTSPAPIGAGPRRGGATKAPNTSRAPSAIVDGDMLGQRLADSIKRMVQGVPLSQMIHLDSLLAGIGPAIEQARRAEQRRPAGLALRHYWLTPSGDSVDAEPLPPDAPLEARTAAAANEIRGHIALMQKRFADGDARGARLEFTRAASELTILREFDARQAADLQRELSLGVRDLLVMCYRMRADSSLGRGVSCENFIPGKGGNRE